MDTVPPSNPAAAAIAIAVRAHLEQSRELIMGMPRAGPSLSVEDARQFTTALYLALVEHLEGSARDRRDSFLEEVVRACRASGVVAQTMIIGVARSYIVLMAYVSPNLEPEVRDVAGLLVGEFCGHLITDIVHVYER